MASSIRIGLALLMCGSLVACGESAPKQAPANKAASAEHSAHPADGAQAVVAPPGAKVFFEAPKDGEVVKGPLVDGKVTLTVKMGVEGIQLHPAGTQIKGTGHHHIIVDGKGIPLGDVVPKDDNHLHYGQGQSEAQIQLAPGGHTLTLQFADGAHLSYGPQLSTTIKVDVQGE